MACDAMPGSPGGFAGVQRPSFSFAYDPLRIHQQVAATVEGRAVDGAALICQVKSCGALVPVASLAAYNRRYKCVRYTGLRFCGSFLDMTPRFRSKDLTFAPGTQTMQ